MITTLGLTPLSLYVHIPWCERKCPYCDFNSHELKADLPEDEYLQYLIADLKADLEYFGETRPFKSIFIGGGTPSLFSAESIQSLLRQIRELHALASDVEITMEANPGSSEAHKFAGFREAGVNRLSIGIQSFNDLHLDKLGRIHNGETAHSAYLAARSAGFDNVNLDLMFGLPDQSTIQACDDIKRAIDLQPEHISSYQLTYEPNTLFHRQQPRRLNDDALWEMQSRIMEILAEGDYQRYEVSAFAQAARQCQHNLNYWQNGDYLGIGAGAHGKITHKENTVRYWKKKHPKQYAKGAVDGFRGGLENVQQGDQLFELLLNGLRLTNGIPIEKVYRTGNHNELQLESLIKQLQVDKLLRIKDGKLCATEFGFRFLDTILQKFLPSSLETLTVPETHARG
ncbi:MAG: radical SAM family heme chaperone HemW [Pseudomonadota bacterium]